MPLTGLTYASPLHQVNAFFEEFIESIPIARQIALWRSDEIEAPDAQVEDALASFRRVVAAAFATSAALFFLLAMCAYPRPARPRFSEIGWLSFCMHTPARSCTHCVEVRQMCSRPGSPRAAGPASPPSAMRAAI